MNNVTLMGRLTKDPELRYTTNNTPVAGFNLAVDRDYAPQGKEKETDFFPCVVWQKKGEAASKYLSKGRRIGVVGRLQNRSWDDTEGKKHNITEIIVENWYFADDKKKEGDQASSTQQQQNGQGNPPPQNQNPPAAQQQSNGSPAWEQGQPAWAQQGQQQENDLPAWMQGAGGK